MWGKIKLEEVETGSKDILAVEGKVNNRKTRIVLCYFDCTKQLSGDEYERNRTIQSKVESLMGVDPGTALLVLGDMNGRLVELEPKIKSDANGEMIKSWTDKGDLSHLNALHTCTGKYTFESQNGRSAIDHMLTNEYMAGKHISMWIDEDKTMLNISDHNLVRAWFKMGNDNYKTKKKRPKKKITWVSRNPENVDKCVENFKARIGKKVTFKKCMDKLKKSVDHTMKKSKLQKPGGKKQTLKAAPWVDRELTDSIDLRSRLSREWRYARKRGNVEEIKECKEKYYQQKRITAIMVGNKKGGWEEKKIKNEDDQKRRRPKTKTTKNEDDQKRRRPKTKTTKTKTTKNEDDQKGRRPKMKTTKMEDDQNGRRPKWKMTKMEDNQNGRRPKWKTTKMEDDQNGRRPKWKTTKMEDELIDVGDCGW